MKKNIRQFSKMKLPGFIAKVDFCKQSDGAFWKLTESRKPMPYYKKDL